MATALFVPSQMPGPILRETESSASAQRSPFTSLQPVASTLLERLPLEIILSGPPKPGNGLLPWRVLFADTTAENGNAVAAVAAAQRFLCHLGPRLSQKRDVPIYYFDAASNGAWRFVHWEAGTAVKTGGTANDSNERPAALSWFSFLLRDPPRRHFPPSLRAWARQNNLPLADVPLGSSWKRRANLVDYEAVAGLERKGLLIETRPIWYRVTVDVPVGAADGGIMEAS